MSKHVELVFCELPATPYGFNKAKFKAGAPEQIKLYKNNKTPNRKKLLSYKDIERGTRNYARVVPRRLYVH